MQRLRLIAVTLLALGFACAGGKPALATNILIQIDKPTQTMTVSVDGGVRYRWRVSTGATGFSTPAGSYTPLPHGAHALFAGVGQCRHAACDLLHHKGAQHSWLGPSRPRHAGVAWLRTSLADQRHHPL